MNDIKKLDLGEGYVGKSFWKNDIKTCSQYVGVNCVNGTCPNALADEYAEYGMDLGRVKCSECFYNAGCKDCALSGTEYCIKDN